MPLDRRLQQLQAGGVNLVPDIADLGHTDDIVGKTFGAVVDEKDETGGEQHKADEAEDETDHGCNECGMGSGEGYSADCSDSIVVRAASCNGEESRLLRREFGLAVASLSASPPAVTVACPGAIPGCGV